MNRDESLAMMRAPERWPLGSRLPLVESREWEDGFPRLGFLVAGEGPWVHLGNVDEPPGQVFGFLQYESLEAVVDAGWRVD